VNGDSLELDQMVNP